MATDVISTDEMQAKWDDAFARRQRADAVYTEVKEASEALFRLQDEFEKRNGLICPGNGRDGTFNYFEKRKELFEAHPAYKVPDEVGDKLEALVEVVCDIEGELMGIPSPSLEALRWKLRHTDGANWEDFYVEQMRADIDRLMCPA